MATLAEMMAGHLKSGNEITEKDYYEAFGKFIDAYARAEGMAHAFFIFVTRLEASVAQAIAGDMSLRDLVGPIKKIAKIHKLSETDQKEIEVIFQQFNHIAQFRHRLIHRSADVHEGKLKSTNLYTMKSPEDFEVLTFNLKDVENAYRDLGSMLIRLYILMRPDYSIPEQVLKEIHSAWRYKPLKPETPNRPPRPKSQPHKRQRRASQA